MDVFIHIPKTAGSTLRRVLAREYGRQRVLYVEPGNSAWNRHHTGEESLQEQVAKRDIRLITGHLPFGVHSTLRRACRYFSLMRDPVARAISEYYYAHTYPHHSFREPIRSGRLSLDEFIHGSRHVAGGGQCAMLSGNSESRTGVAAAAIDNVQYSIAVVGTIERFEESILLMAKALGWQAPWFVRTNVTRLDRDLEARRRESMAEGRECYRDYFKTDYAVYEAVDALLKKKIAAEGEPFRRALAALREIEADTAKRAGDRIYERYEFGEDTVLPWATQRLEGSEANRAITDYLTENRDAVPYCNFVGHVDSISGRVISGWATDLARIDPIDVTIWRGHDLVARARADAPRRDVVASGFPRERVGFRVDLDQDVSEPIDYIACFGDTSLSLSR